MCRSPLYTFNLLRLMTKITLNTLPVTFCSSNTDFSIYYSRFHGRLNRARVGTRQGHRSRRSPVHFSRRPGAVILNILRPCMSKTQERIQELAQHENKNLLNETSELNNQHCLLSRVLPWNTAKAHPLIRYAQSHPHTFCGPMIATENDTCF